MLTFLGIGAQKAGTTWLYEMLRRHPGLFLPGKEVHFWDEYRDRGLEWYESLFVSDRPAGEITPAYAILPRERIAECHRHFPDLRLVYIVRDPVERAWSAALMALRHAGMKIDEASDQWFIDHFNSEGSRRRGDHAACIANWLACYPRDQFLVLDYADIGSHPRKVLAATARHVGVDPGFFEALPDDVMAARVFAGAGHPMRPALRAHLEELYRGRRGAVEGPRGA